MIKNSFVAIRLSSGLRSVMESKSNHKNKKNKNVKNKDRKKTKNVSQIIAEVIVLVVIGRPIINHGLKKKIERKRRMSVR